MEFESELEHLLEQVHEGFELLVVGGHDVAHVSKRSVHVHLLLGVDLLVAEFAQVGAYVDKALPPESIPRVLFLK